MLPKNQVVIGVVSYCSDVLNIWSGMVKSLAKRNFDLDFVTYTSYERQVQAVLNGDIDIAWNGPLAHVRLQKLAKSKTVSLGMRDVDRDFQSFF